ncbi:MAG TPA: hypothetical protein VJ001_17630 [Rhodocyclaceae bacterium]|nr:hypothetical protein [Rhodocyclaceae bacterium]
MNPSILHCLTAQTAALELTTIASWLPHWTRGLASGGPPLEAAIRGGFAADRVAWAFASGYQAALRILFPGLAPEVLATLCVSEESGNRPRDIRTRFSRSEEGGWSISGVKRWSSFGVSCSALFVVGAIGDEAATGRPTLRVARVAANTPGVSIAAMADTPFVPEIVHACVRLDAVRVPAAALLDGDGYARYVKPFRTVEDICVGAASLAYLLREARARAWPRGFIERAAACLAALAHQADEAYDDAAAQVALSGVLLWAQQLRTEAGDYWAAQPEDDAARRWRRDLDLFKVAASARELRVDRAWRRLAQA